MDALLEEIATTIPILGSRAEDKITIESLSQEVLRIKIASEQKNYDGVAIPITVEMAKQLYRELGSLLRESRKSWLDQI